MSNGQSNRMWLWRAHEFSYFSVKIDGKCKYCKISRNSAENGLRYFKCLTRLTTSSPCPTQNRAFFVISLLAKVRTLLLNSQMSILWFLETFVQRQTTIIWLFPRIICKMFAHARSTTKIWVSILMLLVVVFFVTKFGVLTFSFHWTLYAHDYSHWNAERIEKSIEHQKCKSWWHIVRFPLATIY